VNRDLLPLAFGTVISALLAGTFVIAGLKAGITPGVSPLVILCAWAIFARRVSAPGGSRFVNLIQVAGSGGMAVTAGVIFTAPVVQIVYREKGLVAPAVDVPTLIFLSLAGSLIGFGFVGLGSKRFLSDPSLPAPEARACDTMIRAATTKKELRPRLGRSLFLPLLFGGATTLLTKLGVLAPALTLLAKQKGSHLLALRLPVDPLLIGIGALLTLPTALLVFSGAMLRLLAEFAMISWFPDLLGFQGMGGSSSTRQADIALRWVGGGTMLMAVLFSLVKFLRPQPEKQTTAQATKDTSTQLDARTIRLLKTSVLTGFVMVVGWLGWTRGFDSFSITMALVALVLASLMTTLGAILSLQIGSSASPVSGTIFVTTLVLCATALAFGHNQLDDVLILTPLLVAACVAVCSANDSSQDYKTLELGGVRVADGFLAQLCGLLAGCVTVPLVLYEADASYGLGSEALPAPQGKMFATLMEGLLFSTHLPWGAILIGMSLGVAAVLGELVAARRGLLLPAMALAVGIYLPAILGSGILIGALFRFLAERRNSQRTQTNESILTAAGLITGSALLELILGVLILFGTKEESLGLFSNPAPVTAALGIVVLGALVYKNSKRT
jgi:putative OPT family oligopeptide transporter